MPPPSLEIAFAMRIPRVSAFFPEVTQQIHSFRASGVMSFQVSFASGEALSALCKSAGTLWTTPFLLIVCIYFKPVAVRVLARLSFKIRLDNSPLH